MLTDQIWRYFLSAVLSFGTNLALTWLLHDIAGQPPQVAFAVALACVFMLNFLVARYYVFKAAHRHAFDQFRSFAVISLCFRGCEYLAYLVVQSMVDVDYLFAAAGVLSVSFALKFFVYRSSVFSPLPHG